MVKMKTIGGVSTLVMATVMVEAVRRGSHSSRIGIIHVDPAKNAHPQAKKRELPEDVAEAMRKKGLVKITSTVQSDDAAADEAGADGDDENDDPDAGRDDREFDTPLGRAKPLATVALDNRRQDMIDEEDHPLIGSGADTRDTTAFATRALEDQGQAAIRAAADAGGYSPDIVGSAAGHENGVSGDTGEGDATGSADAPPAGDEGEGAQGSDDQGGEQQHQIDRAPRKANRGGGRGARSEG